MDKNVKLYKAAWLLVEASRLISGYENEIANELLGKASELKDKIEIDEKQIEEIEQYEDRLRKIL